VKKHRWDMNALACKRCGVTLEEKMRELGVGDAFFADPCPGAPKQPAAQVARVAA
jgi:hypothetical protein